MRNTIKFRRTFKWTCKNTSEQNILPVGDEGATCVRIGINGVGGTHGGDGATEACGDGATKAYGEGST